MAIARTENLALYFQEVLTAVVRLRARRQQVTDADSFRHIVREAIRIASADSMRAGYNHDDIKKAAFATVALLDESILNSGDPLFIDWPRKPLQEEMFGIHEGGETFFQYTDEILARGDSAETADLLEVYQLCLLLGFQGRYRGSAQGELRGTTGAIASKIRRIRGEYRGLAADWALPAEPARAAGADPWVAKLTWAAIACCGIAVLLFVIFKITLWSGVSDMRALTAAIWIWRS